MLKRTFGLRIAAPVVLMGLTALMVVAVPSAAQAESGLPLFNETTGKCITNGGSTANSAPITQYTCNGSDNQSWIVYGNTIVNADNGKCLTDGGSTANSAPITQYTCNGSANQTWIPGGDGPFTFYNDHDKCITDGGSTANSAPITQYKCNGSSNQEWSQ